VRRALGIRQGSKVAFAVSDGKAELHVVHRTPEPVVSGFGMLDARGKRLPEDFDAAGLLRPARPAKGRR